MSDKHVIPVVNVFDDLKDYLSDSGRGRTNNYLLDSCRSYDRGIELIDIEGPRREILEAFCKSPYLTVAYCIDLKIGT